VREIIVNWRDSLVARDAQKRALKKARRKAAVDARCRGVDVDLVEGQKWLAGRVKSRFRRLSGGAK